MNDEQLAAEFPLRPESRPQPGVPPGKVVKSNFADSRIFPGTVRDYYVYVPAAYDPATPACVMIVQDGLAHITQERRWQIPTVLDNLIHRREIPVCIGIFINPGVIPVSTPGAKPRNNRSFEYDSLSDRYARFLLEEILPEVGLHYNLARDAGSRLLMGGSSGAACAFTAAWHRPDEFQRVLSIVGSYTALRGGHNLAALVRLTEPKRLRIFLEGGAQDLVVFAGSWWTANLDMLAALEYSGYEVNHAWAEHAGHNDFHGPTIFPDALRWIWQDYPRPIKAGVNSRQAVMKALIPGEDWQMVADCDDSAGCLAANAIGEVAFIGETGSGIFRIGADGRVNAIAEGVPGVTDLIFAPTGALLACQPELRRIVAFDAAGRMSVHLDDIDAHSVAVAANGSRYVADLAGGRVWLVTAAGARSIVAREIGAPRCVRLTHDQGQLIVAADRGRMAFLFTIGTDGGLANGAPAFRLNLPDEASESGAVQVAAHAKGWTGFATSLGLQLASEDGSVAAIIPGPGPERITGVAFAGPDFRELSVTCGGKVYRRKIAAPENFWA